MLNFVTIATLMKFRVMKVDQEASSAERYQVGKQKQIAQNFLTRTLKARTTLAEVVMLHDASWSPNYWIPTARIILMYILTLY